MSYKIHVMHQVNGTTRHDWFKAEEASITKGEHATVIDFVDGFLIRRRSPISGEDILAPVKSAIYDDTPRIIRYLNEE